MNRFLTTVRTRYDPRLRVYLVVDNLSCHWTEAVRESAGKSNIELVPTPTYARWLNRIECQYRGDLRVRRQERGLRQLG